MQDIYKCKKKCKYGQRKIRNVKENMSNSLSSLLKLIILLLVKISKLGTQWVLFMFPFSMRWTRIIIYIHLPTELKEEGIKMDNERNDSACYVGVDTFRH